MKYLFVWITLLTALFSSVILLSGALGKTAPPPEFAKWFTYPDGSPCPMPCLFGVRPGITKFDEVSAIVGTHPITKNFSIRQSQPFLPVEVQIEGGCCLINFSGYESGLVGHILIQQVYKSRSKHIPLVLYQALVAFGTPKRVSLSILNGNIYSSFLFSPSITVAIGDGDVNTCRFDLNFPIDAIFLTQETVERPVYWGSIDLRWGAYPYVGLSRDVYQERFYDKDGMIYPRCKS